MYRLQCDRRSRETQLPYNNSSYTYIQSPEAVFSQEDGRYIESKFAFNVAVSFPISIFFYFIHHIHGPCLYNHMYIVRMNTFKRVHLSLHSSSFGPIHSLSTIFPSTL